MEGELVADRQRIIRKSCPIPKLENGRVRMRSNGRSIRYSCNSGYMIHGQRVSLCSHRRWEDPVPLCISRVINFFFSYFS